MEISQYGVVLGCGCTGLWLSRMGRARLSTILACTPSQSGRKCRVFRIYPALPTGGSIGSGALRNINWTLRTSGVYSETCTTWLTGKNHTSPNPKCASLAAPRRKVQPAQKGQISVISPVSGWMKMVDVFVWGGVWQEIRGQVEPEVLLATM